MSDEKTPTLKCVYCGDKFTFIADHHREEHPEKVYDPVWYMDGVEANRDPEVTEQQSDESAINQVRDLSKFDVAIVEDDGTESFQDEMRRFDADDFLRLTESQAEAILEYDRAVALSWKGRKVVVEVTPDSSRTAPVEIREES